MLSVVTFSTLALIAWGALAFGAVYPWAYRPLMAGAAVCAAAWWVAGVGDAVRGKAAAGLKPGPTYGGPTRALALGLAAVALATLLQLVPLPTAVLDSLSPATVTVLLGFDLEYVARGGVSQALSIRPESTWLGLGLFVALGVFLLGLARALERVGVRRLAVGLVGLGTLLAVIGIVQKATFTGTIYGFWEPTFRGSPFGPFVNKNHFAGWMMMTSSLSLGYFGALIARGMRDVKPGWRARLLWFASPDANRAVLVGAAVAVMGLSLVMTFSRSGITCFILALALTGFAVLRRQQSGSKRLVATTYLALVLTLSIGWAGLDAVARRFAEGSRSGQSRVEVWNDTLEIVRDFPIAGTGLNTYGTAMLFYQTVQPNVHYAEAHNDYVQLAAEGGLLLGLPILLTIGLFIREVRRRFREARDDETTYWIRVGAVTGLLAMSLQEVVEFSLQMPGNALLFTVLAAIAIHRSGGAEAHRSGARRMRGFRAAGPS